MMVLVGGGVRSGKSAFALVRARELAVRPAFVATAELGDEEMRARAVRHRAERGDAFLTVEEPLRVVEAVGALTDCDGVVIDCLTLWMSNLLLRDVPTPTILREVERLAEWSHCPGRSLLVVSNEVGMGVVPESSLGRAFRDVSGWAHQLLARQADEVYLGAMGMLLRVKPGPVLAMEPARWTPDAGGMQAVRP